MSGKKAAKRPWLAAVLNLVGWPLGGAMGYSYLHRWGRYVAAFVSRTVVGVLLDMDSPKYWVIALPVWGIVVWDGYQLAKGSSSAAGVTVHEDDPDGAAGSLDG